MCGSTDGCELHHLAPRNVFGEAAEDWPQVLVCVDCHAHWHRMMDGYRVSAPNFRGDLPEALLVGLRKELANWEFSKDEQAYSAGDYLLRTLSLPKFGLLHWIAKAIFAAGIEYGRKGYAG